MTVNTTNITSGPYSGNDVTDTFSYTFRIVDKSQVSVYETDDQGVQTLLTVDTDYTVAGIGVDAGGTITRVAGALPAGYKWFIRSNYQPTQLTAFESQGAFFPDLHENAMDKLTFLIQQLLDGEGRSFRLADSIDIDGVFTISDVASARAGKFLSFNTAGDLQTTAGQQVITGDVIYDNIALAKSASNAVGLTVDTRGRLSAADNFGARYIVQTPAEFGGTPDEKGDHTDAGGNILVLQTDAATVVGHYGAKGDGVTDDSAFFTAMSDANSGEIRLSDNTEYLVDGLTLSGPSISIIGAGRPEVNAAGDGLENGSVLIGNVNIRSDTAKVIDLGVDAGSSRSGSLATTEGLVVDAIVATIGKKATVKNIETIGFSEASATHGLLVEGFDKNEIENIGASKRAFGVVVKGRRGYVRNISCNLISDTPVFAKSDLSAGAGGVADGSVDSLQVTNVISVANASNTTVNHVYVLASTDNLSRVQVDNVIGTFGNAAVRVAGGAGTPFLSSVQLGNINADQTVTGVDLFGSTFDTQCKGLTVTNPSSGKAFITNANSANWQFDDVNLIISDVSITGTVAADLLGSGSFDSFNVRNPSNIMTVTYDPSVITGGMLQGDLEELNSGLPTMLANWSTPAAAHPPLEFRRIPGGTMVALAGSAVSTAGSGTIAFNLPAGFRPNAALHVPVMIDSAGTVGYAIIYPDGNVQFPGRTDGVPVFISATFFL